MKPLRLGAGSRIDSHGVEKDALPKIIFEDQGDTTQPSQSIELFDGALHVFNDPEGPNRTDLGVLPGSGGGTVPAGTTTVIRTGSDLQVGDSTSVEYAPADAGPWTGWAMTIHPAGGTAQVDVLVAGVSITSGGTSPNVSTGTSDTGSTSGWAGDSISAGQSFEVQVTAVTGIVERIDVYLHP